MSHIEWTSYTTLFWNTNDSVTNLMISFASDLSLWGRPWYKNILIYGSVSKCQNRTTKIISISLIVEQILAFASSPKIFGEVKNPSLNFRQIAWRCFTLTSILIWLVKYILQLNSKQFHQKLYSNSFI